jgi:Holliday junction resolvasome RuvABC endonuclease subunit
VRKSSTPDIALPGLKNKNWKDIARIIAIDESLNDSGAALFVEGKYQSFVGPHGHDIGIALKLSAHAATPEKAVKYKQWVDAMIEQHRPDVLIAESHPFARGSRTTSIATMEVLSGIRFITMLACAERKIPYLEFSTNSVKLIMCGAVNASKEMVQLVLKNIGYDLPRYELKEQEINGNVCDAIALGEVICRMQKAEIVRQKYVPVVGEGRSQTQKRRKQSNE